jgi:AcrR family transcriptional regulator
MGSVERRARERADTREQILDAAREMFVEHGYEATTMRAIADRIEYTPTAIYHHFESKEALLTELCAVDFRSLAAAFQRIGRIEDPIEPAGAGRETYVNFALEHPMQYQLLFMTPHPHATKAIRTDDLSRARLCLPAGDLPGRDRHRPPAAGVQDPDCWRRSVGPPPRTHGAAHREARPYRHRLAGPRTTSARMCATLIRGMLRAE